MRHSISMPAARATSALGATQTNKVLRNTYLLLAITLLPTIVGAFVGALYPLMEALGWMSIIVFFWSNGGLSNDGYQKPPQYRRNLVAFGFYLCDGLFHWPLGRLCPRCIQ